MNTRLIATLLLTTAILIAQDNRHKAVEQRGDHMMGFSHDKTTHHFRLYADGGAIEVTANDPNDADSRDQIRMHLSHIAGRSPPVTSKRRCSFTARFLRACLCCRP